MKTELLVIEIRPSTNKQPLFYFNETMAQATFSGLTVVYNELFVWAVGNYFSIWAIGPNAAFLLKAFSHHQHHFKKIRLVRGDEAKQLFENIAAGEQWSECSIPSKLEALNHGYTLACELECLGNHLLPLVTAGRSLLQSHPFVTGAKYSWNFIKRRQHKERHLISKTVNIKNKDIFYRFCVN
jgi:hypothetical protein